ncbi:MAG: hypothetical protein K0R05_2585 [Anaerocolumna sp.]|jgi:D-alanyl-D-alanine carboxypeptidase|nr:hypothetical protein [Anaerocolumna sp.]
MQNRRKKARRMKLLRRIFLVGLPIVVVGSMGYFSLKQLLGASESTASSQFYNNPSYQEEASEDDDNNSIPGGKTTVDTGDLEEEITNNDNVTLDTTPESITVIVNKELRLPSDYIPSDLLVPDVEYSITYYDEKKLMRKEAGEALKKLFDGAEENGYILCGVSAYRSYDRQYQIFTNNVKTQGMEHTTKYSAIPGYSEHQTGLAIDISTKSVNYRLDASFGETPEYEWLKTNAHLYGFIIRYPDDKTAMTGYSFEPWHIRYVGKALAKYLYENNMCLEEYYKFTPSEDYSQAISYDNLEDYGINPDDVKVPTRIPTKKPTPTPSLTPTPTEEPTDTPEPTPTPTKKPAKPTKEPTQTPEPTEEVTVTPEITPTDTVTVTPTGEVVTPTEEPGTDGGTEIIP